MRAQAVAPWRRPPFAPVYAAILAFGVVWLASLVIPSGVQGTVTVTGATGDVQVDIREGDGPGVGLRSATVDGTVVWSSSAPLAGHQVCVTAPNDPWRVVGSQPPGNCTARQSAETSTVQVQVERVRIRTDVVRRPAVGAVQGDVTILDNDRPIAHGTLDATGSYTPAVSLADRDVCLSPKDGWRVADPLLVDADGRSCIPSTSAFADVVFSVSGS